ncbi:MAG: Ig domain-containing protein [Eubacteriales bacterium]|nr:Ig domain-containing protein [Eubacteriales bacterium]
MKQKWISRLLASAMLLNLLPAALAAQTVAPVVSYAADPDSIVTKIEPVQSGTAWKTGLEITTKADGKVYAVLLQTGDRSKITDIATITDGTYDSLPALAGNAHYRSGSASFAGAGTQTIDLGAALPSLTVNETSTTYHRSYTFIVFDSATKLENASDYAEGTFRIDSQGKLQRDSYMVRYMKNGASAGGASSTPAPMPAYQITDWGSATTLSSTKPVRAGYDLLGWDENKDLLGTVPNTAAASTAEPQYKAGGSYPAPGGAHNPAADKIVSLYAIWKPKQVQFEGETKTFDGDKTPQVGVAFDSGSIALASSSATDTAKTYTVTAGTLPAGLKVSQVDNTHWHITGTPTQDSAGQPVTVTLQVQDNGNKTTDTVTVTFHEVKRGLRPAPDLDVNTGLASQIETVGEGEDAASDGQIIGFYSAGQEQKSDEANNSMTDGTGSYAAYYLQQGMVYEYRPKIVSGAAYDNDGDASTETPWREVPAPESYYADLDDAGKTALADSMAKGAATAVQTMIADGKATIVSRALDEGWGDEYGYLQFDEGLPVVHGLAADDVYEIRFRASDTFDASTAAEVTIGGAKGGGGGTSGPPSTDDFCTVVFYDWDNTLLGSRIVAKGGSLKGETLDDCGDSADQAPKPPEGELLYDANGNGEYDFIGNNNAGNDVKNKAGYTFAGWVDYETGYSVPNVAASAVRGQAIPKEEIISLSSITENLIVKAAYNEDALIIGTTPVNRRYLISYTPFKAVNGALQTEITVRRPQNARRAVDGKIYLQIALQPADRGQTNVELPLGTSDVERVTFSMPATASGSYHASAALSFTVGDASGTGRSDTLTVRAEDIVAH